MGTPGWNSRDNASSTMTKYRASVNTDLHFKLFTVPLTNTDTAPRIGVHPLHQSHSPLLHTKFSQRPPDELPRHWIKCLLQVYKSHVESLVGSQILLLQLPDNKDSVCCASAEAKLEIVDWHKLSDESLHNPPQDFWGGRVVRSCRVSYVTGRPTDFGLQLGKACYPCSREG